MGGSSVAEVASPIYSHTWVIVYVVVTYSRTRIPLLVTTRESGSIGIVGIPVRAGARVLQCPQPGSP